MSVKEGATAAVGVRVRGDFQASDFIVPASLG